MEKTNNILGGILMKKTTTVLVLALVIALALAIGNKIIAKYEHDKVVNQRRECLLEMGYRENPYGGWLTRDEERFWFLDAEDGDAMMVVKYPVHICVYSMDYTEEDTEFVLCTEALDPQEGLSFDEFARAMNDCILLGNKIRQVYVYAGGKDKPHQKWIGYDRLQLIMELEG